VAGIRRTWHASGYTQTGLSVGQKTVEFSDVVGWTKPANRTVTISDDRPPMPVECTRSKTVLSW